MILLGNSVSPRSGQFYKLLPSIIDSLSCDSLWLRGMELTGRDIHSKVSD